MPQCIQDSSGTEATRTDPPRKNIQVNTLATYNIFYSILIYIIILFIITYTFVLYTVYIACYTRHNSDPFSSPLYSPYTRMAFTEPRVHAFVYEPGTGDIQRYIHYTSILI